MRRRPLSSGLLLPLALGCAPLPAGEPPREDAPPTNPIVQVLEDELAREVQLLEGPGDLVRSRDFHEPGSVIAPCSPGSAAYEQANEALSALHEAIASAHRHDEIEPLTDRLRELLHHDCIATARGLRTWFPSVSSLRLFWEEVGHPAFRAALDVDDERTLVIPAEFRHSAHDLELYFPDFPGSCDEGEDCTHEAALRSELDEASHIASLEAAFARINDEPGQVPSESRCALVASSLPPESRFEAWQDCITEPLVRGLLLPAGNLRVPAEGWLLFAEVGWAADSSYAAVDLATGATVTRTERSPCWREDPDPLAACESGGAAPRSAASARAARDLLWLLLTERVTSFGAPRSRTVPIPDAIEPLVGPSSVAFGCGGACGVSMRQSWAYVSPAGVTLAAGERHRCGRRREWFEPFTERIGAEHRAILSAAAAGGAGTERDLSRMPPAIQPGHLREDWSLDGDDALVKWSRGLAGRR